MKKLLILSIVMGCILGSCSLPREKPLWETVSPLDYRFRLHFSSQIPEPYPVLSGGMQTYGRFPFNTWCRDSLTRLLAARSGEGERPQVTVRVELRSLQTEYDEIGSGPSPASAPIYNGFGPRLLAGSFDRDDGLAIPSEIHKGAVLHARLVLLLEDREILRRDLREEVETVVLWEDFDAWSYDYGAVLKQLIDELVATVDAALYGTLAATADD